MKRCLETRPRTEFFNGIGRLLPGSRRQSPSAEQRHARQAFRLLHKPVAADKDAPTGMLTVRTVEAQRAAATERNRP